MLQKSLIKGHGIAAVYHTLVLLFALGIFDKHDPVSYVILFLFLARHLVWRVTCSHLVYQRKSVCCELLALYCRGLMLLSLYQVSRTSLAGGRTPLMPALVSSGMLLLTRKVSVVDMCRKKENFYAF